MDERMVKGFNKEEEFLDEFGEAAIIAADHIGREWKPNFYANDSYRASAKYFLSNGDIKDLVFDTAYVYHIGDKFSSIQIILKSSNRQVTVKVKLVDGHMIAEKIIDRSIE